MATSGRFCVECVSTSQQNGFSSANNAPAVVLNSTRDEGARRRAARRIKALGGAHAPPF